MRRSPAPQVSGPVAAPDVPGAPTHNYPFFASNHDLAAHGYVEEEYFIKGTASTYDLKGTETATVKDGGHPFVTRIVVRRPADAKRFNGTAVVEWDNVTNMFDAENVWFFDWEDMMRSGYVWVGVSAQTVGIDALKKWNADRYGTLDVGSVVAGTNGTGGGTPAATATGAADADAMSFDIFSQVGQALRHPGAVDPLHGLKPKLVLAAGESQSARRLGMYVNSVHPLAHVYDGFLLLSAVGLKIRPDLVSPVIKISTEHDVVAGDAAAPQPDSSTFRAWEVAGTSHVDQHLRVSREALELRDLGKSLEAAMAPTCSVPSVGTRVPTTYVVASAFEKLAHWAAGGAPPPAAPRWRWSRPCRSPTSP
ncbi:MAG: alpha/beta hydrolase domain-containing protein [Acetobacteraceae bacterium]